MKMKNQVIQGKMLNREHIVGIDPGLTGAFVVQDGDFNIKEVWDMPVVDSPQGFKTPRKRNKKTGKMFGGIIKKEVDSKLVYDWLMSMWHKYHVKRAIIEMVISMPRQNISATFSQARSWQAVVSALQIIMFDIDYVFPISWKKKRLFAGKGKSAPREYLLKFLHTKNLEGIEYFSRVKDNDRADAFWIGRYYFDKKGV
jgi:hypothetical protein